MTKKMTPTDVARIAKTTGDKGFIVRATNAVKGGKK